MLSVLLPALHAIDGHDVPLVWGFCYANLAFGVGVVYRREFLGSGLAIFVAALVAVAWPRYNGFVLGPVMGLGLAVPGWLAERRVRAMRSEDRDEG